MEHMDLLDVPRLGILITSKQDGSPIGVPIWFDWDGTAIRFFTTRGSKKMKRLASNPKASLLVTNNVGEPEGWVCFDGEVTIKDQGGIELAEKLAGVYWDLDDEVYAKRLESWKESAAIFTLLEMVPTNIRSGS